MQLLRLADLETNLSRIIPGQTLNIIKEDLPIKQKITVKDEEETEADESEEI